MNSKRSHTKWNYIFPPKSYIYSVPDINTERASARTHTRNVLSLSLSAIPNAQFTSSIKKGKSPSEKWKRTRRNRQRSLSTPESTFSGSREEGGRASAVGGLVAHRGGLVKKSRFSEYRCTERRSAVPTKNSILRRMAERERERESASAGSRRNRTSKWVERAGEVRTRKAETVVPLSAPVLPGVAFSTIFRRGLWGCGGWSFGNLFRTLL